MPVDRQCFVGSPVSDTMISQTVGLINCHGSHLFLKCINITFKIQDERHIKVYFLKEASLLVCVCVGGGGCS